MAHLRLMFFKSLQYLLILTRYISLNAEQKTVALFGNITLGRASKNSTSYGTCSLNPSLLGGKIIDGRGVDKSPSLSSSKWSCILMPSIIIFQYRWPLFQSLILFHENFTLKKCIHSRVSMGAQNNVFLFCRLSIRFIL